MGGPPCGASMNGKKLIELFERFKNEGIDDDEIFLKLQEIENLEEVREGE